MILKIGLTFKMHKRVQQSTEIQTFGFRGSKFQFGCQTVQFSAFVRKPNKKVWNSDRKKYLKWELYSYKMEHPTCLKSERSKTKPFKPTRTTKIRTIQNPNTKKFGFRHSTVLEKEALLEEQQPQTKIITQIV